jgi:uncharacterized protein YhaN
VRQIHSLPEPKEFGFRWRPFDKARKKLERVEAKRKEVGRREAELKARIESEKQEDVKRLAAAILSGSDESAPPELEDLAAKMKELHRLSEALKEAEPQAGRVHPRRDGRQEQSGCRPSPRGLKPGTPSPSGGRPTVNTDSWRSRVTVRSRSFRIFGLATAATLPSKGGRSKL